MGGFVMKCKMKKLLAIATMAAILCTSSFGCGKEQEVKTNAPKQKTVVRVMSWWNFQDSKPLKELKSKFESANPDYELQFDQIATKYADKVLTVVAGGGDQVPDVMMLAMDVVPRFAKAGAIQPLDKYITDSYKKDLYPVVLDALQFDGKIYAAPRDITSFVMYCNKKMFEDAKVPIPKAGWTWNDFLETAKKLTKLENGKPVQWGYHFSKTNDSIFTWLIQNGAGYTTSNKKQSILSSQESQEAIQFLYDLTYKHKVSPTITEAKQFGTDDSAAFLAGKVAMQIGGLSTSVAFDKAGINYVKVPLPIGKKQATTAFVNSWTIPKGAKNPDASWKVIEFLSSKEGQQIALSTKMGLPASKSVDISEFIKEREDNKYLIDALEYSIPFTTLSNGAEYYDLVNKSLEKIWFNQAKIDEVTKSIDSQGNTMLNK